MDVNKAKADQKRAKAILARAKKERVYVSTSELVEVVTEVTDNNHRAIRNYRRGLWAGLIIGLILR